MKNKYIVSLSDRLFCEKAKNEIEAVKKAISRYKGKTLGSIVGAIQDGGSKDDEVLFSTEKILKDIGIFKK